MACAWEQLAQEEFSVVVSRGMQEENKTFRKQIKMPRCRPINLETVFLRVKNNMKSLKLMLIQSMLMFKPYSNYSCHSIIIISIDDFLNKSSYFNWIDLRNIIRIDELTIVYNKLIKRY